MHCIQQNLKIEQIITFNKEITNLMDEQIDDHGKQDDDVDDI